MCVHTHIFCSPVCAPQVHVETYGSLSKKEKVEFILEQTRLVLAKKDYVRAYIVSQKVNRKVFDDESFSALKVRSSGPHTRVNSER